MYRVTSSGSTQLGLAEGTTVELNVAAPVAVAQPRLTLGSGGVVQRNGSAYRTGGVNAFQLVHNDYPSSRLMSHGEIDSLLDKAVTLKAGVVRALTLGENVGPNAAHLVSGVTGTGSNPTIQYRSAVWEVMDYAVKAASDRGLYLVATMTGEPGAYHGAKRDWVNFRRPGTCSTNLSVNSASSETERTAEDFYYTDQQLIWDQRKYAFDWLNHVNQYTGRAYKNEPAINLQTGNELWTADRFPNWQPAYADYIASIAPDTFILDGMSADTSAYWETVGDDPVAHIINLASLQNPNIKAHGLHPYSDATAADVTAAARRCASYGKAAMFDEYAWSKATAPGLEAAARAEPNVFFTAFWSLQNDGDAHNGGSGANYGTDDASLYVPGKDATQQAAIARLQAHAVTMQQ
jgi:mannan endo-1,4-beta-mannosidase